MGNIFTLSIIVLASINALRMMVFFLAGDIYDLLKYKKKTHKKYNPLVSIVIAAHNEEKVIERCLNSIINNMYKNFEVIVINDGSTDLTSFKIKKFIKSNKKYKIRLVEQSNQGKAAALNNGIKKKAKGQLIMSLDADSYIKEDAILNGVKYFQDPKIVALGANIRIIPKDTVLNMIQLIEYLMGYRLKKASTVLNIEYVIGGIGAIYRKSILKKCKYYDTDTVTEDIDLTLKIIKKGNKDNKVIYANDVICFTEAPLTFKSLFRQRFRWKFGRFQSFFKNHDLFFNKNKKYSKLLTMVYLPFLMWSELAFLLDPIFIIYILYVSIQYQNTLAIQAVIIFMGFYSFIAILSDEESNLQEKLKLILVSPLSYFFLFTISMVEYLGLIKCLFEYKKIFNLSNTQNRWEHVERIG